ncbi:Cyclic nucleotide-gated ion channel 1 [Linum perenne]
MRIFNRQETAAQRWNKVLLVLSGAAMLIDPLFIYLVRINKHKERLIGFDNSMGIQVGALRCIVDVSSVLISVLFESTWPSKVHLFTVCHLLQLLGAMWYTLAIRQEMYCWVAACVRHAGCDPVTMINYGNDKSTPQIDYSSFFNRTCPRGLTESGLNHGIYDDAFKSGILESQRFDQKFLYSFWWGLQSLRTFGQNLKPSTDGSELVFALIIVGFGLLLLSQVIDMIKTRVLALTFSTGETKKKQKAANRWMSSHFFPDELKTRFKQYLKYVWERDRDYQWYEILKYLPNDLRKDVNRHIWLPLIMRGPLFEKMDAKFLDAVCDRLKIVFYPEGSYIVREGDPVYEMFFIIRGKLQTTTTNGRVAGFYNYQDLSSGDFFGDELLTFALSNPLLLPGLPISTKTVRTRTRVEAFSLTDRDLKFIVFMFRSQLSIKES